MITIIIVFFFISSGGTIFAFGDSLTEGMGHSSVLHDKSTFHPYANTLRALLPDTTVIESGVSGERVESMRRRLKVEMTERTAMTSPLVVVILGGTNNIGMHSSVASTAKDILGMHEDLKALLEGDDGNKRRRVVHTVAVTLPTFPMDHLREPRIELNALIREYAAQSQGFTMLLDIEDLFISQPCNKPSLKSTFPHSSSSSHTSLSSRGAGQDEKCRNNKVPFDPENTQFWDSRSPLHFSKAGYEALGRIVFERLCEGKSYFTK